MSLRGYIDPNFPPPGGPDDSTIIIYGYTPHVAMASLAVALFAISSALHAWQLFRYRSWYFTPMLVGTLMEIVGYAFRLLSSQKNPYNVIYFVVQYFFIVVAPVFFSAAIYTLISIMIRNHAAVHHQSQTRSPSPLPPKVILWLFIVCDVIATGVQIGGAASIGKAESNRQDPTAANNVLLAGLAFQCFTFLVFIIITAIFLVRVRNSSSSDNRRAMSHEHHDVEKSRSGSSNSTSSMGLASLTSSRAFLPAFLVATLLVYLRTVFRLAETAQGVFGYLSTHEAYFGTLEFMPVVLAVLIFNVWHPGKCLPRGSGNGWEGPSVTVG